MRIDGQLFRFDDEYQKKRARIFVSMFDARMLVDAVEWDDRTTGD